MVHTIAERLIVPEEFGSVLIAADVSVQNKTSSGTFFSHMRQKVTLCSKEFFIDVYEA